ncbi:MAG: hypothetical protein JWM96_529 [Alphaproteobacteria bacterium]|nr:hypothetical protein [Alphaproteobacteria bacterium]
MKLIQLNAWGGPLAEAIGNLVKKERPDILHLQEVVSSPEGRSDFFDFLQIVQEDSGLENFFFSPTHDYNFCGMKVYFGNAILSRFPFTKTYDEFTNSGYIKDFRPGGDPQYNNKLFQHGVASLPHGRSLNMLNYHGYNAKGTNKQGNELTEKHCQRLARYIDALEGPVILTGDFNLAPDSLSLKPLNEKLLNLCIENKVETTRNQFARNMTTVDYIWVSDDITVNRFEVLPDLVSDHAALLLEFDV